MRKYIGSACLLMIGACTNMPPASIGSPAQHGFVVVEGGGVSGRAIQEVTLENTQWPGRILRGGTHDGLTWFSNLEPGTYRVKDIKLQGDPNEFTYSLPKDGLAEPILSFTLSTGELHYLGHIEIDLPRFNLVPNKDEMRVWERLYDRYASTAWEPLILKRLEATK